MSSNRQRFLTILSKWPVTFPKKEYDYGFRLRKLLRDTTEIQEVFPGTSVENARKLDALMRLINNSAKNEFPTKANTGACGYDLKEIKNLIKQQINLNEKSLEK